ncbi:hypothetical protein K3181_03005 [Qipengyuania sp. YG27]|uniref:Uncharacterized protein n=1 Tax=Qipengyuania mesophila TaxID=2867246 RepID=A0ABS7JS33_9SPHN|nr:hypothetical protein [Qipengyuania mesophila]MBX7500414.1 hypothetical protein [Qipengyuania mesophila]
MEHAQASEAAMGIEMKRKIDFERWWCKLTSRNSAFVVMVPHRINAQIHA